MDLELSEEQQLLKQAMREFAEGEIAPGAAERDEHARFPSELVPKLAEQGLLTGELAHVSREELVEDIVEETKLALSVAIQAAEKAGR